MADRLQLSLRGFRQLRNDPGVARFLRRIAEDVADTAGRGLGPAAGLDGTGRHEPFEVDRATTRSRTRFLVYPATGPALGRNRKHNTLVRVLGGVRR